MPVKQPLTETILIIHVVVAVVFLYLAWAIYTKRQIPQFAGVLFGITAVALVVAHVYFYTSKKTNGKQYGISVDPNDPRFDPIGGRPGGITWV